MKRIGEGSIMQSLKKPSWFTLLLGLAVASFVGVGTPSQTFAFSPTMQPANSSAMSEQKLSECVRVAKSGDVKRAFELAKQAKDTFSTERLFIVSYVNTLVKIVQAGDSSYEAKIVNEAIQVVNQVRQTERYDGIQDPEASYYFMQALGRLAAFTSKLNEGVSAKIRIYEGKIALALSKNPKYPQTALESLAPSLLSMARGYAIRGDQQKSATAIQDAVDVGFGDFDKLLKDPLLQKVHGAGLEQQVVQLKVRHAKAMERWSQTVLTKFQPFDFHFDLENIQGGRITSADFNGKVVVLDMWATWCGPCRQALPHYIELQKQYGDHGVSVFGVSMDNPSDPFSALGTVRDFAAQHNFNYPCAMGDQSFSAQVPGQQMLPTTLFIDQTGRVRYVARGYHNYAKIEAITKFLASESQPVRAGMPFSN